MVTSEYTIWLPINIIGYKLRWINMSKIQYC